MELREIKRRFDLRALIPPGPMAKDGPRYRAQLCLWHQEDRPSLLVYPDGYLCRACGVRGDIIDWLRYSEGLSWRDAVKRLEAGTGLTAYIPRKRARMRLKASQALDYHFALTPHALAFYRHRGLDTSTVVRFQLGYGPPPGYADNWFAIPVYRGEELVNIKFRRDDSCPDCKSFNTAEDHTRLTCQDCGLIWTAAHPVKYLGIQGAEPSLFNSRYLHRQEPVDKLLITEGEFDAMAAAQAGWRAVCSTGGAQSFQRTWAPLFRPVQHPFIVYDNDDAGEQGRQRVKLVVPNASDLYLPVGAKGDLNDFLRQHDPAELDRLVRRERWRRGVQAQFAALRQTTRMTYQPDFS